MNPSTGKYASPALLPLLYDHPSRSSDNPNGANKTSSMQKSQQDFSSPPTTSRTKLACVSLHRSDRIRLLNFRPEHVQIITDVVRANAVRGVQKVRLYDQATEIKLGGYPWMHSSTRPLPADRIGAIRVMMAVLKTLYELGWVVQLASGIWRKGSHDKVKKDTVIMRHAHQPQRSPSHWLGISFDSSDLLNIINAPPLLGPAIAARFGDKVRSHKVKAARGYYEIKFRGYPWSSSGTEAVKSRLLILGLLEVLEEHGFRLYTAIDQGDAEGPGCDTWYCCRDVDYVEGTPVY